jgi:hypothetical protein
MLKSLTPVKLVDAIDLSGMTTEALKAELASVLGIAARDLVRLAAVWAELERRGEDLSALRSGLLAYLPRIAAGVVLPETVVRFMGQPALLRKIAGLPPDSQRRLTDGDGVLVAERSDSGWTHRLVPAHRLSASQVWQVFDEKNQCIRTETEQQALLTAPAARQTNRRPSNRGKFKADPEHGVVYFGRQPVEPADMVAALADLKGDGEELGEDAVSVSASITPAEHKKLKRRSDRSGASMSTLIRDALRAGGLI